MAAITSAVIAGAALVGAGMNAYGNVQQTKAAKSQYAAQMQQQQAEQAAEALRRQQMELEGRRRQREIIRNQQRANATALAVATNQGAQSGSGLQGGYGQISGDSGNQQLATMQNLEIGRGLYDVSSQISAARMAYTSASSAMATAKGWSSLGSSLVTSASALGNIAGGYNPGGTQNNPYNYQMNSNGPSVWTGNGWRSF